MARARRRRCVRPRPTASRTSAARGRSRALRVRDRLALSYCVVLLGYTLAQLGTATAELSAPRRGTAPAAPWRSSNPRLWRGSRSCCQRRGVAGGETAPLEGYGPVRCGFPSWVSAADRSWQQLQVVSVPYLVVAKRERRHVEDDDQAQPKRPRLRSPYTVIGFLRSRISLHRSVLGQFCCPRLPLQVLSVWPQPPRRLCSKQRFDAESMATARRRCCRGPPLLTVVAAVYEGETRDPFCWHRSANTGMDELSKVKILASGEQIWAGTRPASTLRSGV
ncbi:unnamed protein product [Miscanthus lutarioriparius]|uniref:Uncharacterized protein n=1 Tax=Miscanthus lutarioriparius TaxID=422564 RepID=A0A811QNH9_9POAL|nr:unnamed protein product [Miscanthus lutarioriparius]